MRLLFATGAAVIACALASQACAQTINTAMDLPTGAVIDLVIEKTGERTGSQAIPKLTATFRYKQAIVATDEGYVVTQTLTGIEAPPEAKAMLQEAAGALKTITFEADASVAPVKVKDREAVLAAMFDSVQSMTSAVTAGAEGAEAANRAVASMRSMFGGLSDEQLAQTLLKEQGALSQFQSIEIDLTKPVVEVIESPNPMGGQPFQQTVAIKLESHDKAAGRAIIAMTSDTDPEALKQSAIAMLQQIAPEQRDAVAKELATAKMEMRTACRYEMDLKTGMASRTDCTRTISGLGNDGKLDRRVDRSVITQTLRLP